MNKHFLASCKSVLGLSAAAALLFTGQVSAAEPWLAGPSVMAVSQIGTFSGGNLTPVTAVKVVTKAPGSSELGLDVLVAPDGTITYDATPTTTGTHHIRIVDSAGKELAATQFIVQ